MGKTNDQGYTKIINSEFEAYQHLLNKKLELHTNSAELLEDEIESINYRLTDTHNSNPDLNSIFFKLYNEAKANKSLNHIILCEEYCINNRVVNNLTTDFFVGLFTLYKCRKYANDKLTEITIHTKSIEEDIQDIKLGEYTLARRILAIELILKAAGKEIGFGELGINKIKMAEFIDFLTSKENKSKEMRDTKIYEKVKVGWDRLDEAPFENLVYIKNQFSKIGLTNLTQQIDNLITSQKSKEK